MSERPIDIIREFYPPGTQLHDILVSHCRAVAGRALEIARGLEELEPDMQFIEEAALLHDIGIYWTDAPGIGCRGEHPYVCHGTIGRELLEKRGLPRHGRVCECHVGVGFTAEEIRACRLPLPVRDMVPVTLEEEIICYADKFFSKKWQQNGRALTFESVLNNLRHYGEDKARCFLQWAERFDGGQAAARADAGGL